MCSEVVFEVGSNVIKPPNDAVHFHSPQDSKKKIEMNKKKIGWACF